MAPRRSPAACAALLILGFLASAFFAARAADPPPVAAFDGRSAWAIDSVLASATFGGRRSGTPDGRAAEEWIAANFAAAGLEPGAGVGAGDGAAGPGAGGASWFQPLDVCGRTSRKASLTLLDGLLGEVHFALGEDFVPLLTPGDAKVTAEAVLAGYGIDVPEKGRDDYAGIDLRGRIAVILRGRPQDGQDWEREFSRTHTYAAAKKRGAVAVLYCQEGGMVAGAALDPEVYDSRIPAAYVSERMLGLLLRETGWTLERWRSRLEQGPQPIATYKRIRFESRTRGPDVATARNVLALLRGSDPALAGDLVIFGAHHDGIGADAAGRVYPGANDNASGTAVVLEAARAARASGWRPRRSVLFVTFAAEELGLLGSAACARQLPWDSTRVVAMVNVDMAGHGDGGFGIAGGSLLGRAYFAWREGLDSLAASRLEEYRLEGGRSDHAPFLDRGIRTATAWSRGDHERYHDYEDRAGYVRPEVLESAGRGIFSLVVALADDPRPVDLARGREARLAADALTIDFSPVDLAALQGDPVRGRLDGDGRMAGRLVALDRSRNGSLDLLAAIGELDGAAERLGWCERAATIEEAAGARDRMTLALLPVAPVGTLDGLPAAALRPLLRGGLAGAIWSGASAESSPPLPSASLCGALAAERRFLLADGSSDWRGLLGRTPDLTLLVRVDRSMPEIPGPPDTTGGAASRVVLVLHVDGLSDSSRVREAIARWGGDLVHLDLSSARESGIPDTEILTFLHWMAREMSGAGARAAALLGGNLRAIAEDEAIAEDSN